ncbi:MAG: hypothetical protein QOJ36_1545 [Verrucomicrobiota bacterium]|jgi:hypothetical protein
MIFIRVVRGRRECLNAGFILVVPEHGCFPFSKGIPAPVLQENRNFLATCSFHAIPVLATGESQAVPEIAQAALALLCQTYWPTLYTSYPSKSALGFCQERKAKHSAVVSPKKTSVSPLIRVAVRVSNQCFNWAQPRRRASMALPIRVFVRPDQVTPPWARPLHRYPQGPALADTH